MGAFLLLTTWRMTRGTSGWAPRILISGALLLALGYAGWAPGQLESEIQANGWLNCAADSELIFGTLPETKYAVALRKIGIDPAQLSSDAGHA